MELCLPGRSPLRLDRPRIMGVLNVTPDSFSDGGRYDGADAAMARGRQMAEEGADIIDIGGESSRPGAQRVSVAEQKRRVLPVIARVRADLDSTAPQVVISIDTTRTEVAEAALDAGASILNDISAGRQSGPGAAGRGASGGSGSTILELAARRGAPVVLMHMQGEPATMQQSPTYLDVVHEVESFLLQRVSVARRAGVPAGQIIIDPGIGFGKSTEHNLALLARLDRLVATGYPVLVGASRKRFIAAVSSPSASLDPADRIGGSCAMTAMAVAAGVSLLRVHAVAANRQAADVALAVCGEKWISHADVHPT